MVRVGGGRPAEGWQTMWEGKMAIKTTDRVRTVAAWSAAVVMAMSAGACASAGGMGMAAMGSPDGAAYATTTAVDMAEVEEAQLALQKAQNAQVRQYAQRMVTDHAPFLQRNLQTMDAMGMDGMSNGASGGAQMNTSAPGTGGMNQGDASASAMAGANVRVDPMAQAMLMRNPYSRPLVEDHMRAMQMLQSTQAGMAFDRAYMMRQVAAHRSALAAIDNLMGSVQATGQTETRGMMMQHRAAVEQHLRMAEQMVASMGG
jgi:predicted outer membrane protein